MRHPSSKEKVNYVKDFIMDPCDAPIEIYAEVAFKAALRAIVSYYCLDMVQIFTGYVRPHQALKGLRGTGHSRSGRGRGKPRTWLKHWNKWSSFDPWDSLGRNLPGADDLAGRDVGGGVKWAWYFYGQIERLNHIIMIYSIVEQFFYDWASGMTATQYCQEARRPWCTCYNPFDQHNPLVGDTPMLVGEVIKARRTIYAAGNGIAVEGERSQATFSGIFEPYPGFPRPENVVFVMVHSGGYTVTSPPSLPGEDRGGVQGTFTDSGLWQFYIRCPMPMTLIASYKNVMGEESGAPVPYPWDNNPCSANGSWKPNEWIGL